MSLRNKRIDQIDLRSQPLEEHVAARRVRVALHIYLRQIGLDDPEELFRFLGLDPAELELDGARLVLGRGGLELEVEGHHGGVLGGGGGGFVLCGLGLGAEGVEFAVWAGVSEERGGKGERHSRL